MYCKFCNNEIPDEAVFCPNCGTPVEDMLEETGVLTEPSAATDNVEKNNFNAQMNANVYSEVNKQNYEKADTDTMKVPEAYVNPQFQNAQSSFQNNQYYAPPQYEKQAGWQNQGAFVNNQTEYNNATVEKPNIVNCYKKFWKNYTNFSGRSRRSEYWYVVLVNVIISLVLSPLCAIPYIGALFAACVSIYSIAIIVPTLALIVRRLHDIGKDWYYIFIGLIPIAGAIILLVWYCQDSQPGANQFGENPKGIQM